MEKNFEKVRTRFAPSPTGYMHIGNLRTALYCFLIARHENGEFVVRIEDTDQNRYVADAERVIYETLKICKLDYDEGPNKNEKYPPYYQSERMKVGIYKKYAMQLVEQGDAYVCFCGKEEEHDEDDAEEGFEKHYCNCSNMPKEEVLSKIDAGEKFVIRQKVPCGKTAFDDIIYGHIEVDNDDLEDMILLKSDGFPTYNFANVIDDHLMNITHIVRGNEYISSTPKYVLLYKALKWDTPNFIHVPLITNEEHKKLSKRSGHASVEDLLLQGFLPECIVNFVALLGWSSGTEQEFFTLEELCNVFDYHNINKSPAVFDIEKFKWMNGEYFKKMEFDNFYNIVEPKIAENFGTNYDTKEMAELLKTRIMTFADIPQVLDFVNELPDYDLSIFTLEKLKANPENAKPIIADFISIFENVIDWDKDNLINIIKSYIAEHELKNGIVLWPLRAGLSGKASSAGGAYELLQVFGKDESLRRLKIALDRLSQ